MKHSKKIACSLAAALLAYALSVPAMALDDSAATALSDFESFETTDDLIFNWYVQPSNEKCGELSLDTSGMMHGKNCLLFDYSMKGAQSTGKGWCTINFVPDDTKAKFGDGVKFTAKSDNHISARLVIVDGAYTYKQYFFDVGTEAKDYVIRWEDFQNIPGQKTFDPATAEGIASADIAIISDNQPSDFNGEGKFWFDDFCTFTGSDETTPSGKAMAQQADPTPVTDAPTTPKTDAQTAANTQAPTTSSGESTPSESAGSTAPANNSTADTAQGGGNWWIFAVIGAVVVIGGGIAVFFVVKNKKAKEA